jgi:hypothetical protein
MPFQALYMIKDLSIGFLGQKVGGSGLNPPMAVSPGQINHWAWLHMATCPCPNMGACGLIMGIGTAVTIDIVALVLLPWKD